MSSCHLICHLHFWRQENWGGTLVPSSIHHLICVGHQNDGKFSMSRTLLLHHFITCKCHYFPTYSGVTISFDASKSLCLIIWVNMVQSLLIMVQSPFGIMLLPLWGANNSSWMISRELEALINGQSMCLCQWGVLTTMSSNLIIVSAIQGNLSLLLRGIVNTSLPH